MAELITQFTAACSNIEPEDTDIDNAVAAHEEVREHLEADEELVDAEIDTVLIGSYKRHVSIKRVKDVDVFSKVPAIDMALSSQDLLDKFLQVLTDEFTEGRVEPQDRSIKVLFDDYDLHVDVVPARPADDYWEVPDGTDSDGDWQETNPEKLTALSTSMNDEYSDLYVPVVKLIRQTRRANLGDHPGGLFFEILTYHSFDGGLEGENRPQLYVAALRSVANQLADTVAGGELDDPTMADAVITVRSTEEEMQAAANIFAELATKAEDALGDSDSCRAAKKFHDILGKTTDGEWVFPMPAYCNDDGTRRVTASVAGERSVPAGDHRFA